MKDERKRRKVPLLLTVLLCVLCLLAGSVLAQWGMRERLGPEGLALVQADQAIRQKFVGEYDRTEHDQAVLRTMVDGLGDRWSYYLTPEEYQEVQKTRENSYVGIGNTVRFEAPKGLKIVSVQSDGPSAQAGLKAEEFIQSVEGLAVNE